MRKGLLKRASETQSDEEISIICVGDFPCVRDVNLGGDERYNNNISFAEGNRALTESLKKAT